MTPRTDTQSTIQPGAVVGGYRVRALAGRGAMGEVYRASGPAGDVALKLIGPWLAGDPGFRARFGREAEIAAGLQHPNVVPVHAAGDDGGLLYIAMGWVEGDDLATRVERDGPLTPAAAARVVADVAAALDAAHAHGLVHRDVRPGNVLVGDRAYLSDFGLAKLAAGGTRTGQFISSVGYVAPEQVRGEPAGPATDVYALGCVLLFALSGLPPFPADTDLDTMQAHVEAPPPPATARVAGLPPALDAVLAHALAKDPGDRYGSAGELAAAVAAALAGEDAGSLAPVRPAPPRPRRRRGLLAGAAVLGAAALAAAALLATGGDGGAPAADGAAANGALRAAAEALPRRAPRPRRASSPPSPWAAAPPASPCTTAASSSRTPAAARSAASIRGATPSPAARCGPGPARAPSPPAPAWCGSRTAPPGPSRASPPDRARRSSAASRRAARPPPSRSACSSPGWRTPAATASRGSTARRATWSATRSASAARPPPSTSARTASGSRTPATARSPASTSRPRRCSARRSPSAPAPSRSSRSAASCGSPTPATAPSRGSTCAPAGPAGPPVRVGREPVALTHGAGAIWVANRGDGTVTRIDATTGRIVGGPVTTGGRPAAVAFGAGALWVADPAAGTVTRVAP